jgi:hypothetical protein
MKDKMEDIQVGIFDVDYSNFKISSNNSTKKFDISIYGKDMLLERKYWASAERVEEKIIEYKRKCIEKLEEEKKNVTKMVKNKLYW